MTGHGKKQKNFAACLGCTEYALVLGTNQTLCAINKMWQVQWAFLPSQGLERWTSAINNSKLWDYFSASTLTAEKTRNGLACMSRCISVLCSGWVAGDRETVTWNLYVPSFTAYLGTALEATIIHKFLVLQANKVSLAKDTLGSSSWSWQVWQSKSNATMKMHKL